MHSVIQNDLAERRPVHIHQVEEKSSAYSIWHRAMRRNSLFTVRRYSCVRTLANEGRWCVNTTDERRSSRRPDTEVPLVHPRADKIGYCISGSKMNAKSSEAIRRSGDSCYERSDQNSVQLVPCNLNGHLRSSSNINDTLKAIHDAQSGSRTVDVMIARSLGLKLINPFVDTPHLVECFDNEWMVVKGDRWPPVPRYTGSTDDAISGAGAIFSGVTIDSAQTGAGEFRAALHGPDGFFYVGSIWPTRPLSIIGAAFEALGAL